MFLKTFGPSSVSVNGTTIPWFPWSRNWTHLWLFLLSFPLYSISYIVNIVQIKALLVISLDTNLVQTTTFSHPYHSNSQEEDYCSHQLKVCQGCTAQGYCLPSLLSFKVAYLKESWHQESITEVRRKQMLLIAQEPPG